MTVTHRTRPATPPSAVTKDAPIVVSAEAKAEAHPTGRRGVMSLEGAPERGAACKGGRAEHALSTGLDGIHRALVRRLESAGWRLASAEINAHDQTARIEIKGVDGRLLTLDARSGRASITRERVTTRTVVIGRRGDRCPVDRLQTEFIGRTKHEGFRSAMRSLAAYLADNAPTRSLPREEARRLLAPLLGGWAQ